MIDELCALHAHPTQVDWRSGEPNSNVKTVIVPIKTFHHNYLVHENFHCEYSQFSNNQKPGIQKIDVLSALVRAAIIHLK